MADKVQKIREEVQRLQDLTMDKNKNFYSEAAEGEYNALCNIEHFIDSLQEEPTIPDIVDEHFWEMLGEEPVSEELEEACEQLAENARKHKAETSSPFFSQTDYRQGVIDGVKWQIAKLMKDAIDVTVHIEAGNYPYIPQMELYDYDKDVTLAKEGDKYKVVLIKEE